MIYLKDILNILFPNQFIVVLGENNNILYRGVIWQLFSKYMLSCPVVALYRKFNIIYIVIAYD